jgi:streptogramin lyase
MKMQPFASRSALTLAAIAILGGCSGNSLSNSGALPTTQGVQGAAVAPDRKKGAKQKVEMIIKVPRAPKRARGRQLRPYFVASSTQGVQIVVYAQGSTTPLATTTVGIAPGSTLCQPVTGGRSCTVAAEAPVGNDTFTITTYDAAPSGGSFTGAKQLGFGTANKTVVKGHANSIGVTVGGVVAASAVVLSWPNTQVINNDTQTVTVSAKDADGNTLVSDGWFDANGNAVTMAISSGNISPISLVIAPTTATFAAPTATLTYTSSQASPAQIQNGLSTQISAAPSNGTTVGSALLTFVKPAITEYTNTTNYLYGIAVGPDNALWYVENGANKIGRITTGGSISEFSTGMTSGAMAQSIASGPDGRLWFTESGLGKVASITTSGTIAEYLTPSGNTDSPYGIVAGPDGNMWFTEDASAHSNIGKFLPSALDGGFPNSILEYATPTANSNPAQIAVGPDNKLWFTESTVDKIASITTAGTGGIDYALVSNSIEQGGITAGSDGAMWFAEQNPGAADPNAGHRIGRITTSGSISLPVTFANTFASPAGIVTGPDGAIWFAENGNNAIGRISPTDPTHTLVEFPVPTTGGNPYSIVKGPDGALWFTECLSGKIGRLQ